MPTVQLYQTWIYAGKFYGPGAADLPDDVHAALKAKGAFDEPAPPELPNRAMISAGVDLAPQIMERLAAAGLTSGEAIAIATDAELLEISGIGPAALREIRATYGGGDADPE